MSVVADLIGLSPDARKQVLSFAGAFFNSFGPRNYRTTASLPVTDRLLEKPTWMMNRAELAPCG